MDCSRALLKDFIELCKLAKKKINWYTHQFYSIFWPPPNSIAPKLIRSRSSQRTRQVAHSFLPLSCRKLLFFVDCCVLSSSFGGRLQPRSGFFHFIFRCLNRHPKQRVIILPKRSSTAESCTPPHRWYCFRLVVVLFRLMAAA